LRSLNKIAHSEPVVGVLPIGIELIGGSIILDAAGRAETVLARQRLLQQDDLCVFACTA
jgi:hypothetical protein